MRDVLAGRSEGELVPTPLRKLVATSLVVALLVAACGGDGSETTTTAADTETTQPGTDTTEPTDEIAAAAQEAEELGLSFATSREEILAGAEAEGQLVGYFNEASMAADNPDAGVLEPFMDKYPFLRGNIEFFDFDGTEERQLWLLEAEAGATEPISTLYVGAEDYHTMGEYCDWDLYGMAEAGILDIPLEMIDPDKRTIIATGHSPTILAYNLEAFEDRPLPETWDDIIEHPELYSREAGVVMLGDVRATGLSSLAAEWGIERAAEWFATFGEVIDPVWNNRVSTAVTGLEQGEYHGYPFATVDSVYGRLVGKPDSLLDSPEGDLAGIAFVEPVPVRLVGTLCVVDPELNSGPYSGLLFLEWLASEEGQRNIYENHMARPYSSSIYAGLEDGVAGLLEGKETSVVAFEDISRQPEWIVEINEAAGFPQVEE